MSLPESWRLVSLPQLAELIGGGTPERSNSEYFGGDIPWITPSDVTKLDGMWIYSTQEYLTEKGLKNSPSKVVPKGSVLMATRVAVGRAAIAGIDLATNQDFTNLIIDSEIVDSEYLARAIEALSGLLESRSQGSTIKGIPRTTVERLKIPLPTLLEQQRIVDVLRQAEAVAKAKKSISDQVDHLIRTAYWEYFGAWFTADGLIDPVRIGDYVADSQYGVSEAMGETGTHAVLRMNSMTTSGWLDLADLKYASLSKKDIESTELQDGDLLFNRTNSKELVGKCAIWRPVTGVYSFASYLVRFRLKPEMLPEFLWATLNSAYGKYRLLNSAKQAVSMANVSPTDLGRIMVPLPPFPLQEKFAIFVRAVEGLRTQMLGKSDTFVELQNIVSQKALIGDLTTQWRADHATKINEAAHTRDALLRERGAKIINASAQAVATAWAQADATVRPARHWLLGELSEFQHQVLNAFTGYCQQSGQPLLVEDSEVFARFCDDEAVTERLQAFGESLGNCIRRTLSQLASLGQIAKITLPKHNPDTGEREYLKAFRPLRPEEFTRMNDLAKLRKALEEREGSA